MKTFKFYADIEFTAEDLFEAFDLLRSHFDNLSNDEGEDNEVWFMGEMTLKVSPKGSDDK